MLNELSRIEDTLKNELAKYYGLSFDDLAAKLGLNAYLIKGKASTVTLINKLWSDVEVSTGSLEEKGINLDIKSVRLKENGIPKESMSFEQIKFHEVVKEKWEDSFLRKKFFRTVFCFFVFQEKDKQFHFKGVKVWKMPSGQLENEVQRFWNHLNKVLLEGVVIEQRNRGANSVSINNLPSSTDNPIMHVRPKAKDSNDKVELPDGNFITKQAYWLNASFVAKILEQLPKLDIKTIPEKTMKYKTIEWGSQLHKEIYTIDEIMKKGKSLKTGFSELDIDEESLRKQGYRIESSFVIREGLGSLDDYLNKKILSNNYFDSKSEEIFDEPYVKRKIENYENAYKLLKVENSLYITEIGMKSAQVSIDDLTSYKKEVEDFVQRDIFFTIESLRAKGFTHEVEGFGFDNIFYESILKRPGRLKTISFASKQFFIKTVNKVDQTDFIRQLMDGDHITLNDLISNIVGSLNIRLPIDVVETSLNRLDGFYYATEMNRLFVSKGAYLDYLDR
jgi:hypothetical protein